MDELKSKMAESLPTADNEERPARRDSELLRPRGRDESPRAVSLAGDVEESLLQCSVCLEPFHIPKALPCLHVFCLGCLENIESSAAAKDPAAKGKIQCPQCRRVSQLPEQGAAGLPTSHMINSLLDLTEKHRKKSSSQVECTVCSAAGTGRVVAARFCFTCGSARCTDCTSKHDRNPIHESHVSVDITEDRINSVLCPDHAGQCVVCFCTTCCRSVCTLCIHKDHSEHSHVPFMVASRETDRKLDETKEVLHRSKKLLDEQKCRYQENRTLNDESFRNFKAAVEKHTEAQIRLLRQQQDELLEGSRQLHVETDNQIKSRTNLLDKILQSVTGEEEQTNYISYPLSGHNAVVLDKHVPLQRVTLLNREVQDLSLGSTVTAPEYNFVPGPDSLLGTREIKNKRLSVISRSDTSSLSESASLTSTEADDECLRTAKWSEHEGMENISDICIYNENEILCVSGLWPEKSIFRLDKHGVIKQLPSSLSKHYQGIFKLASNGAHLAILKKYSNEEFFLTVLSTKDDSFLSAFKKQSYIGTFPCKANCQPRAITITKTGDVVIATVDKNLLCCYSPKGDILWERDVSPQIQFGGYHSPVTMTTDSYSRVLVVDMGGNQVNVYTGILFNFAFPSPADTNMNPVAVCQADNDNYFVAFSTPEAVVSLFDQTGQLIRRVVRLQHPPTKIQYIAKYSLLVVGTLGYGVIAYKIGQK